MNDELATIGTRTIDTQRDEKSDSELKEKQVSAVLMLTNEQPSVFLLTNAMDDRTLSGTAEFSEAEVVDIELRLPLISRQPEAKLVLTSAQQSDFLEAFNLLDYTGEGKINAEDFRVVIKALGYEPTKEELQKLINSVDKGDTGRLSFENFQTAIMRKIMSQDCDGDIMKSFRLFDMDDTGLISFENVKKVAKILGCSVTDEEIEEMIDDADKDFDGCINVQEFMKMIKNSVHIVTP